MSRYMRPSHYFREVQFLANHALNDKFSGCPESAVRYAISALRDKRMKQDDTFSKEIFDKHVKHFIPLVLALMESYRSYKEDLS